MVKIPGAGSEESLSLLSLTRGKIEAFGFAGGNTGFRGGEWVLEPVFWPYSR